MPEITLYTARWCRDCRRTEQFLSERGIPYRAVNVDEDAEASELIIRVNNGKRKIPTIEVAGRYFHCSPFDPYKLSKELNIPLNS